MLTKFDKDIEASSIGNNKFIGEIATGWSTGRGPNGGYIAACLMSAMNKTIDDPTRLIRSLTTHYLSPPSLGEYEITLETEKSGKSATFITARMRQRERVVAKAFGAFAINLPGPFFQDVQLGEPPSPNQIAPSRVNEGRLVEMHERYISKVVPDKESFPNRRLAKSSGWLRLSENRKTDSLLLAAYSDAWLPSIFTKLDGDFAVPTLDLTIHFRSDCDPLDLDEDAFCFVKFKSQLANGGFIEEDGEIYDPDGRLLAQSRQLALLAPM